MTQPKGRWIAYSIIVSGVVVIGGWFAIRVFLFDFHSVPSVSMYPTIAEGSIIIVDKRGYGNYDLFGIDILHRPMTATIARGDIVVHKNANESSTLFVKRIIGLPGDRIEYQDNHLTINGKSVTAPPVRSEGSLTRATEVLDQNSYSIAWDSTRYSTDYEVVVPDGHYVVFGDNRNNARDSRFVGPIPKDLIAGKVVKVIAWH